jgi:PIF1-like helicase
MLGKSYLIDCLVTEAEERYEAKYGKKGTVIIIAPTGKAALNAGGVTMHSKNGLSIPTKDMEDRRKNELKPGKTLLNLQQRIKETFLIILDEYSMTSSAQFYWIFNRLQQGKSCGIDVSFGGVTFVMFGDPGQLPPVGGTPLWCPKTSDGKQLGQLASGGHNFYKNIQTVMWLTEVRRQQGFFKDFLGRLRDGKNTKEDWIK